MFTHISHTFYFQIATGVIRRLIVLPVEYSFPHCHKISFQLNVIFCFFKDFLSLINVKNIYCFRGNLLSAKNHTHIYKIKVKIEKYIVNIIGIYCALTLPHNIDFNRIYIRESNLDLGLCMVSFLFVYTKFIDLRPFRIFVFFFEIDDLYIIICKEWIKWIICSSCTILRSIWDNG